MKKQIVLPRYKDTLAQMGEQIKLARKRRKLTAVQVAERADIARSTLSLIEKGDPSVDRKSTRLNSSHVRISYAVFCLKKKKNKQKHKNYTNKERISHTAHSFQYSVFSIVSALLM